MTFRSIDAVLKAVRIVLAAALGMSGGATYSVALQCQIYGKQTAFASGGVWFVGVAGAVLGLFGPLCSPTINGSVGVRLARAALCAAAAAGVFALSVFLGRALTEDLAKAGYYAGPALLGFVFGLVLCRYDPNWK